MAYSPFITRYELNSIIGLRADLISHGSKPMIDITKLGKEKIVDPEFLAWEEYRQKTIPIVITRRLPNKEMVRIKCCDFIVLD